MNWSAAETNTHQDHVIAHVVGATPLGYLIWDETAFVLLDIGFIWNIYLDMEMGLLPQSVAITELEADDEIKIELRSDIDLLSRGGENLARLKRLDHATPIESVELFESEDARRLVLLCEQGNVAIETSESHRWTRITASICD
jgi:hypothetical protein